MVTSEQKLLAVLSHASVFIGGFIWIPLIVLLVSKDEYVKKQAKEALIFHLSLIIGCIISGILCIILIGILGLIALGVIGIVLPIIAIIAVINGEDYSYPITGKWASKI